MNCAAQFVLTLPSSAISQSAIGITKRAQAGPNLLLPRKLPRYPAPRSLGPIGTLGKIFQIFQSKIRPVVWKERACTITKEANRGITIHLDFWCIFYFIFLFWAFMQSSTTLIWVIRRGSFRLSLYICYHINHCCRKVNRIFFNIRSIFDRYISILSISNRFVHI